MTNGILDKIRRRDPELAAAIDREAAVAGIGDPNWGNTLSEEQKARFDAWLFGQGYLVDGRRVPPDSVQIVRAPR